MTTNDTDHAPMTIEEFDRRLRACGDRFIAAIGAAGKQYADDMKLLLPPAGELPKHVVVALLAAEQQRVAKGTAAAMDEAG